MPGGDGLKGPRSIPGWGIAGWRWAEGPQSISGALPGSDGIGRQCLSTKPKRRTIQPCWETMFINQAKQVCQTAISCCTVGQPSHTGMPNSHVLPHCLSTKPNRNAKQPYWEALFINQAKRACRTAITRCTVNQSSQTGMPNSHIPLRCLLTRPNRHAKQPYPVAELINQAKRSCLTVVPCCTVYQPSQTGMPNSQIPLLCLSTKPNKHAKQPYPVAPFINQAKGGGTCVWESSVGQGGFWVSPTSSGRVVSRNAMG